MKAREFFEVIKYLPVDVSVLLRGSTGIGKSECVAQAASSIFHLPLIDRRLSQMAEGDLIGLPREGTLSFEGTTLECTRWKPGDWILEACLRPHVLFVDEINRASQELMQAAFQLVLDREIAGHKLHPLTRVFTAINPPKSEYAVRELDPAFLNRFFVIDFTPDEEDWIAWARNNSVNSHVLDFFAIDKSNHPHLHPSKTQKDVLPTPRSWVRLGKSVDKMENAGALADTRESLRLLTDLCNGFVGKDATAAFVSFVQRRISGNAIDVRKLLDGDSVIAKRALALDAPSLCKLFKSISCVLRDEGAMSQAWKSSFKGFFEALPKEMRESGWTELSRELKGDKPVLIEIHKLIIGSLL